MLLLDDSGSPSQVGDSRLYLYIAGAPHQLFNRPKDRRAESEVFLYLDYGFSVLRQDKLVAFHSKLFPFQVAGLYDRTVHCNGGFSG